MRRIIYMLILILAVVAAILLGYSSKPGQREFNKAIRELKAGRLVRARALIEKAINKSPDDERNGEAYNYLGVACARLGQQVEAVDALEQSRALKLDLADSAYNLGVLMYASGNITRAIEQFTEAALIDESDTRAQEYLAALYRSQQQPARARRELNLALTRHPDSPSILSSLALVEWQAGHTDKAYDILMQALSQDPNYPPALFNLGVLQLVERTNTVEGAAFLEHYLAAANKNDEHLALARRIMSSMKKSQQSARAEPLPTGTPAPTPAEVASPEEAMLRRARAAVKSGEKETAAELYLRTAELDHRQHGERYEQILTEGVEQCPESARLQLTLGLYLAEHGRHDEALPYFKSAITLRPDWTRANYALAASALKTGETDAALLSVKKVTSAEPDNADAAWLLAAIYEQLDLETRAAAAYNAFATRFPEDSRALKAREKLEYLRPPATPTPTPEPTPRASPTPASTATPTPAPTIAPPEANVMPPEANGIQKLNLKTPRNRNKRAAIQAYNRGTLYQHRRRWDQAIFYYRRALENDDTFGQAYFNLGTVYRATGDSDLAKAAYIAAIKVRPDLYNARYNLALIYWENQQPTAAEEQLRELLRVHPNHAQAYYLLGLIYAQNPKTRKQAVSSYRRFLELAPNDRAAPAVRHWLETPPAKP